MVPDNPIAESIVLAVAEAEGVDPAALDQPLTDVVDPDALDVLFAPTADGTPRTNGRITFRYCGHQVAVRADGHIEVDESAGARARVDNPV